MVLSADLIRRLRSLREAEFGGGATPQEIELAEAQLGIESGVHSAEPRSVAIRGAKYAVSAASVPPRTLLLGTPVRGLYLPSC
jgi:hypothetical protein